MRVSVHTGSRWGGYPHLVVEMSVQEALHVGMELGNDGRELFNAAWDLLPDDAPELKEYERITNSTNTKPAHQCDVTDCDNPSVWVDVGDAGDFYLCSEHMRP